MILVQRTGPVALPGQEERVRRCGRDDFYVGYAPPRLGFFLSIRRLTMVQDNGFVCCRAPSSSDYPADSGATSTGSEGWWPWPWAAITGWGRHSEGAWQWVFLPVTITRDTGRMAGPRY